MTLALSCQPGKSGNMLVFRYRVQNNFAQAAYVMDAMPGAAPDHAPRANDQGAVVLLGPENTVILGKFIAPLPTDRRIAVPMVPLARRLAPGAGFENCLNIPIPMAETSPYFGDLPLRQYEVVEIAGTSFTIGYWLDGVDGLAAEPVDYAAELFHVVTRKRSRFPAVVSQRFPTNGLQLFKRRDAFPRPGANGS
jgi:hypothetical protein